MYCSDWSNGIQYQVFDTRPATEFNVNATADAQKRRRTFNVGRVLVLNTPPCLTSCTMPPMPAMNIAAPTATTKVEGRALKPKAMFESALHHILASSAETKCGQTGSNLG